MNFWPHFRHCQRPSMNSLVRFELQCGQTTATTPGKILGRGGSGLETGLWPATWSYPHASQVMAVADIGVAQSGQVFDVGERGAVARDACSEKSKDSKAAESEIMNCNWHRLQCADLPSISGATLNLALQFGHSVNNAFAIEPSLPARNLSTSLLQFT